MFWKNVETASPPGRSSWSITVRLAALYALTTFALLLIATVFLYAMLERYLDNKNQQFVAGEVRVLCEVLREGSKEDRWELLDREIKGEAGRNPFARYYIRILETSGRELFTTPRMDGLLPPACFPPPGASQGPPEIRKYTAPGGLPYLLAASEALEGRSGKYPRIIQVALDTSPEAILLADYRRKALVVLLLGIVFPAAAGWAVARRGLRPLQRIAGSIQRIRAARLDERIGGTGWPREIVPLAEAFDEMLDRLEDSFNRLSRFSADLAHELRTPINNLRGEAEVALSRPRTLEEYRQTLESSMEEYARLSSLIDNLLFLSRSENLETKIQTQRLDAAAEVEAVREFYEALAQENGVAVIVAGAGQVRADSILFRRAVSNLVGNALQYTSRGGRITIGISTPPDGSVEVTVGDTGVGIGREDLSKVFDRFYRSPSARSLHPQGMGLGLSIVRSIMALHGGTVSLRSEIGRGTSVILHFPPPAPGVADASPARPPGR